MKMEYQSKQEIPCDIQDGGKRDSSPYIGLNT